MEEKKNYESPEVMETEEQEDDEKGFTAYLEIYGKSKMLAKVYDDFKGDPDELDEHDLDELVKYLENMSGIDETHIYHAVLSIKADTVTDDEEAEEE